MHHIHNCFPDELPVPEQVIILEELRQTATMNNPKYRGFKGMAAVFPEFLDHFRFPDINLVVRDPDFVEDSFELLALRVFFFGIHDQFCHTSPSRQGHFSH
jgi:hypothetical protein